MTLDEGVGIGFRADASSLFCAVVSGTQAAPILEARTRIKMLTGVEDAAGLAYVRDQLLHLLQQHKPARAAVRFAETAGRFRRDPDRRRARIEGVVLETVHSSGLSVGTGPLQQVAKRYGLKNAGQAKALLKEDDLRGLDWSSISDSEMKEAIMVAVSVLRG